MKVRKGKIVLRARGSVRKELAVMLRYLSFWNNMKVDIREVSHFEYSDFSVIIEGKEEGCMDIAQYIVSLADLPQIKIRKIIKLR